MSEQSRCIGCLRNAFEKSDWGSIERTEKPSIKKGPCSCEHGPLFPQGQERRSWRTADG
ncbi:DUF1289 domain-containing protein [bacterium]|nr:DUF1289 domain-containing protein [bacterium]